MKTHGLKNADKDFLNAVNATEDALMKQATRASHMVQANLFIFFREALKLYACVSYFVYNVMFVRKIKSSHE